MIRRRIEYLYYYCCLAEARRSNLKAVGGWDGIGTFVIMLVFLQFGLSFIVIGLVQNSGVSNYFTEGSKSMNYFRVFIVYFVPNIVLVYYFLARDKAFKSIAKRYENASSEEKKRGVNYAWASFWISFLLLFVFVIFAFKISRIMHPLKVTHPINYHSIHPMHLDAGDVWKYGETTNQQKRYSYNDLTVRHLAFKPEFVGTQMQAKIMEKCKIYAYFFIHGHLPPGNRIFR